MGRGDLKPALRDVRDGVVLVTHPGASDDEANLASVALGRRLRSTPPRGLLDAIPGASSLLITFDPALLSRARLGEAIDSARVRDPGADGPRRLFRIPVVYGGADLPEISRRIGMSPEEFARRHAAAEYRVAFLGFAPGFAYLAGLPAELRAARLASPRTRVPAGSVGIGGEYTGIYPSDSPGGWNLIGRSTVRFFEPDAEPPALLAAGDRVRFEAVERAELSRARAATSSASAPAPAPTLSPGHIPVLRVLAPGLSTTLQGSPVHGLGSFGVPAGGAMDRDSLARANAAVGNAPGAPGLEMTGSGPELEFLARCEVALAGADLGAEWNGVAAPHGAALRVAPGDRLSLGLPLRGARCYLAVSGGFATGGRGRSPAHRLGAGDLLHSRSGSRARETSPAAIWTRTAPPLEGERRLRVVLGPEAGRFEAAEVERFLAAPWTVSPESDRRGLRLQGPPLAQRGDPEIPPSGTVFGSIQVPGSGLPIVLGPDGPVTGGYPRIATVIGADLALLGQAAPGSALRFAAVSLVEALAARRESGCTMSLP